MEEVEESVNFITCAVWVPRGAAKENPDKVEVSKEDLARIIAETKDNIEELEEVNEEEYEAIENEASGTAAAGTSKRALREDDTIDFDVRYQLKDYEEEEDSEDKLKQLLQLGSMAVHASNEEDPYVTLKDEEDDDDSEKENHAILPSDNLIAVGHVEGEAAILEVYVYNEAASLYVHHDILLPAVPLAMEWLNYDPSDEQLKPANLVAIGSMSPVIDVWDLDLVDSLEPAFSLGSKAKKKKKIPGVGHKKPVLSLAWNKHAEHVLASGSVDETVILWDMQHGTVAQQLKSFEEKVQSLAWHHQESHGLAAGSCDGKVRIFDCRGEETCKTWKVDGEVECVLWDALSPVSYNCLASTDKGKVYLFDARQEKPLWTLDAHTEACTGIVMSPKCPGCLVTISSDKTTKIWDIVGEAPALVEQREPKLGTMTCLASCPDLPFVFCMGGDNKKNNFKVWDIRESEKVRARFCGRVGLPADCDEMEVENGTPNADPSAAPVSTQPQPATSQAATANPNPRPKFKKKKGGHLDRRRRRT